MDNVDTKGIIGPEPGIGTSGTRKDVWEEIIVGGDPGGTEKDGSPGGSPKPSGPTRSYPGRKVISGTSRTRSVFDTGIESGNPINSGPDSGEGTGNDKQPEINDTNRNSRTGSGSPDGSEPYQTETEETPLVIKSWGATKPDGDVPFSKVRPTESKLVPTTKPKVTSPQRKQSLTKKQVLAAHNLLAKVYKDESLSISDDDAGELADAILNFTKEMGFEVSGKTAATGNLILTMLAVEVPVILKVIGMKKSKKVDDGGVSFEPIIPS